MLGYTGSPMPLSLFSLVERARSVKEQIFVYQKETGSKKKQYLVNQKGISNILFLQKKLWMIH